jgi:glycosyltransferase involved in cell wall biosynthesis
VGAHSRPAPLRSPLVSAVIPAYNSAHTILRAIASAWKQEYRALEVVVVDDGSIDNTRAVVASLACPSIRLVSLGANRGAAAARNAGIRAARGVYVGFLDADDVWLPRKLALQVQMMEQNPSLALVTCDSFVMSPSGNVIARSHEQHPPASGARAWEALLAQNFIPTPTVLARRQDLEALGGFDPQMAIGEDLDLWIRLALRGPIGVVPEVLAHIYDEPESLMKRNCTREYQVVWPMIQRYLRLQRSNLSGRQTRAIIGRRCFSFASNLYERGAYFRSAALFGRSAVSRFRTLKSLVNVPRALLRPLWPASL